MTALAIRKRAENRRFGKRLEWDSRVWTKPIDLNLRSRRVSFRVTEAEHQALTKAAGSAGSISGFARQRILAAMGAPNRLLVEIDRKLGALLAERQAR